MQDATEGIRRMEVDLINSAVESEDKDAERTRLETLYGKVWSTEQIREEFEVLSFMAPYVVVRRRSDDKRGSMEFQHTPRFYFNFGEI